MGMHEVRNGGGTRPRFQKAGELFCDSFRTLSRLSWQDGALQYRARSQRSEPFSGARVQRDDIEVRANSFLKFA